MGSPRTFFWENLPPEKLWYLVGLITADGSLSKDGRHIDITSKERDFLEALKASFGLPNSIGRKTNSKGSIAFRIQIGSKSFYRFLRSLGLTTNKSKTLGKIGVPENEFSNFLQGVIDGDGCIRKWKPPNFKRYQWYQKINSGRDLAVEFLGT